MHGLTGTAAGGAGGGRRADRGAATGAPDPRGEAGADESTGVGTPVALVDAVANGSQVAWSDGGAGGMATSQTTATDLGGNVMEIFTDATGGRGGDVSGVNGNGGPGGDPSVSASVSSTGDQTAFSQPLNVACSTGWRGRPRR